MWLSSVEEGDALCKAIREPGNLKEKIYSMPEYQAAWNNDPTVKSAIVMLDTIKRNVLGEFVEKYYQQGNKV